MPRSTGDVAVHQAVRDAPRSRSWPRRCLRRHDRDRYYLQGDGARGPGQLQVRGRSADAPVCRAAEDDAAGLLQRARWAAQEELGERNPKLWIVLKVLGFCRRTRSAGSACDSCASSASRSATTRSCAAGSPSPGPVTPSASSHRVATCMINEGCRFDTGAPITIGDRVYFGHDITVLTTTHDIGPHDQRCHGTRSEAVSVGAGGWVGTRALILPGVAHRRRVRGRRRRRGHRVRRRPTRWSGASRLARSDDLA